MITYKQYNFCRKIGLPPIPHVERHFAVAEFFLGALQLPGGIAASVAIPTSIISAASQILLAAIPGAGLLASIAIANLLVARDQKLKYEQYVELCQEKNTEPLDRAEYNKALFALEQDARIKGYKLKIEYKKKKIDIKSDIKKLKAEKYLMDKTAFQEKLQELKGQLKENKANFRSKVADIDSSYLAERKAKYGHFYY